MGNIGSGTGSSYPGALDYQTTPEVNSPSAGMTKARAAVPNDLAAAVISTQTELGTDPAGSLADVKTYLQTEHNTDGTHKTLSADTTGNALTATTATISESITDGTNTINTKIIAIGDWNMDSTSNILISTATLTDLGISYSKIRDIHVNIRNDDDNILQALIIGNGSAILGGIQVSSLSGIYLYRITSGFYDSVDYDSTSYNRGWIIITYIN